MTAKSPARSRRRKSRVKLASAVAISVGLTACGGGGGDDGSGSGDIEEVTLQYANPVAEGDAQAFAGTVGPWIELVSEKTDGAVTVDVAHGGSLLSHTDMAQGIGDGLADLGSTQLSIDPSAFPMWSISGMHDPGVGTRVNAFQQTMITRLLMSEVPALAEEMEAANIKMLFSIASSPHHLLTREPIDGLGDLDGKQIRTYGGFMPGLFESVGSVPVTLPPDEAYTALDRGVVDGAYSLPAGFVTLGWYEVASQVTLVGNGTTPPLNAGFQLAVNADVWEGLADGTKVAMLEAAREMERQYSEVDVPEDEQAALDTMEEEGLIVAEMSESDVERWSDAYPDTAWTEFADRMEAEGKPGEQFVDTYMELIDLDPEELEERYNALWDDMLAEYRS